MRLTLWDDDDACMVWASPEIDHGDWPFRYLLRLEYTEHYNKEWAEHGRYYVSIEAVSPTAAGPQNVATAISGSGMDPQEMSEASVYTFLRNYGIFARLWSAQGNNKMKLLTEARRELRLINTFFGFYMDKLSNVIGDTGWDAIRGDYGKRLGSRKHAESETG